MTEASSNASLDGRHQQFRQQLVHRNGASEATANIPLDGHSKPVSKTRSSKNKKQYQKRCEYIHIVVVGGQLKLKHTEGIRRELHDQFIAPCNGKPPWSTKAFILTVYIIVHHVVVSSGIVADQFHDKRLQEWTKQALNTFEEATEVYMVEVIAKSHF